jgi:hypothetical protein
MANIIEYSLSNPIKMFEQEGYLPLDLSGQLYGVYHPAYNSKPFDKGFFFDKLNPKENKVNYFQPFQTSDVIRVQFLSTLSNTTDFAVNVLNSKFTSVGTLGVTQLSGTYNGMYCYVFTWNLYDTVEDIYFIRIGTTTGTKKYALISEPLDIKKRHKNTVLIKYDNSYHTDSMIYDTDTLNVHYRVHGAIVDVTPKSDFSVYDNQQNDMVMISGTPSRIYELVVGICGHGVPSYQIDKLERITMCDNTWYDGVRYTRLEGSKFEGQKVEGMPLTQYSITLGARDNKDVLEVDNQRLDFGAMPQTNFFWVEKATFNAVVTNIRKGFAGKQDFLNYLNQYVSPTYVYFTESNGRVIAQFNDTIIGTWGLADADVLKYGVKLTLKGSGTFSLDLYAGGTEQYAVIYGDSYANINKTNYSGVTNITKNYASTASNVRDMYVFVSDGEQFSTYTSATMKVQEVAGDFAPSTSDAFFANSQIKRMANNMFTYLTAAIYIDLSAQQLDTWEITNITRWLYDSRNGLDGSCEILLNGQTPSAPPYTEDSGIGYMIGVLTSLVSIFQTD